MRYEVIFQDEWNNLTLLGIYETLDDAIPDINECLEPYDFQIKQGDISVYPGTFGQVFDREISDLTDDEDKAEELAGVMVRGFVLGGTDGI